MRDRTWAALAALAAAAAFLPALAGGFVYDDHRFYADNAALGHASILWRAFGDPVCQTSDGTEAGLWRPLRTLSFALDRSLFGDGALGPHAVNLVLHGAATACVFGLLRRFAAAPFAAFLGALLYAFHPAQTECVAWISSRGDLLAALFVWSAILADLGDRRKTALALGAAALLSKEQAVVWPVLAFLASRLAGRDLAAAARRALAPAVVVVIFLAVRHSVLAEPTQQGGLGHGAARGPQIAAMLGHQAWYTFIPAGGLFDWQMPPGECPWPAALVACAALAAAVWRPTRLPALWFLAALVPTLFLQAFMPLNILVADRFLLFALPALAIAGARGVSSRCGAVPASAAVLCLGALTQAAIPVWTDDDTLWRTTADRVPGHARANHWLGAAALRRGEFDEAVTRLAAAAAADPFSAKTRFHLGAAREAHGRRAKDPKELIDAFGDYTAAAQLCADPRTEGPAEIRPLALAAAADVALAGGVDEFGAEAVRTLVSSPRPAVPEAIREAWERRIESLARSAEVNPLLGSDFAGRVRAWGTLP